ncbi:hypothetical protein M5K25_004694 [Dendrobium thyrsiflorum]|uniref:Uncharacterized protein n=1 Tax=Dendrobium thyrsiflorum TaxID=117978 RepID=A0ABD0VMP8_DENTH
MTPLLSCVTYLIMTNTPFEEAYLVMDYIQNLTDIRHPSTKRKKNIALGHLVCYILEKKYNIVHLDPPTEEPIFFTNASFRALFNQGSDSGGEGEPEEEATPVPAPAPAQDQNTYQDLAQRFGHLETHFDQHFDQLENRLNTQLDQHNADIAWMRGQTDYINANLAMEGEKGCGLALCHHQERETGEGFSAITRRVKKDVKWYSAITGVSEKGVGTLPSPGKVRKDESSRVDQVWV